MFWYENNKEDLENLKHWIYTRTTSDNPLSVLAKGREAEGQQSGATQGTASKVDTTIIPALEWAMNPENTKNQDIESAAYIALAKIAKLPDAIEKIRKGLSLEAGKKRDPVTIESAALALGLLRRAEVSRQFSATELDKVREVLFGVVEDDNYHAGARSFAAMSLGLLGDQPTGSGEYSNDIDAAQRTTTAHVWDLLGQQHKDFNISVSLFIALGLQPKKSVTEDMLGKLAEAVLKGRLDKIDLNTEERAFAAQALGRIGTPSSIKPLQTALTARTVDRQVQRSVAIALGQLGRLVPVETRVTIANVLREGIEKSGDNSVKNFGLISLAYLVTKDIQEGRTDVLDGAKAGEYLLQQTKDGNYIQRPFGAMALGLIGRELGTATNTAKAYEDFKQKALDAMRDGFQSPKLDKRSRAGFAVALGIIGDTYSRKGLTAVVADTKEDRELRGYSAIALGLIHVPNDEIKKALHAALEERSEDMRQQVATALGMLQDGSAVETLLKALDDAESQNLKGQIVLALAKIGDARAVDPMVSHLKDGKEGDLTRALACAGLGVVGDLERMPSLSLISKDINYRAGVYYVTEVLSIL
jgi:HEAT repeat protein